ncbi:hypothetical protein V7S43_007193 [Phytophthora oleae]|uniref:Cyclic nucleotide-binding domain-containing protein n=1 Tax=Phytophthora oleae TaxID=2107226 RepID=A0ABD3FRK4_9STRA
MAGTSEADAPHVLDISSTNQDNADGLNAAPSATIPSEQTPHTEEKNHTPVVLLHRSIMRSSRRNSTQMSDGTVYPVAKAEGEAKPARKRSVSTRGIVESPPSAVTAWSSGLRRSVSDIHAHAELYNRKKGANATETPYEEMMQRFQIRQLQRTPSSMTTGLEDLLEGKGHTFAGSIPTARTPRGQSQESYLIPSLSARNVSEQTSNHDAGTRTTNFLYLGERSTINTSLAGARPPLESGTSSLQLMEQFNLAYGTLSDSAYCPSRWNSLISRIKRALNTSRRRFLRPISPYSTISQTRYAVTALATVIFVLWFPLELAFQDKYHIHEADTLIGVLLGLDVLFTLHTSYMTETGSVVISHWHILLHYLKTRFFLDALISVPLLAQVTSVNSDIPKWMPFALNVLSIERLAYMMRFVRIIWLVRANQSGAGNNLWAWLMYSRYSHLFRIAGIVCVLICIAHYIACIWTILLTEGDTFDEDHASWYDQYSSSFYAALLLLQGEGVPTNTAAQNLFASLSVVIGSIVLAVVFGHVAILVSNFNANTTSYQRKMEEVFAMTAKLQLPAPLRERIHEYYEHLWHEYECLDGEIVQFSKELSHTLGLEVVLFKYMEVVMHVPFWKDCTPDFQKQLMLLLDVRVYLPNDFIMREGEVDDEFYMINRGYCEIHRNPKGFERVTTTTIASGRNGGPGNGVARRRTSVNIDDADDAHRQSAYELDAAQRGYYLRNGKGKEVLISRGQAFGDIALLMNYQRAANVRAVTHVEMCVLSREYFQVLLARYPEDRHRVVVDMITSYMQSYELKKSRCPLLELVRSVYSTEAIAKACAKAGGHPPLVTSILTAREAAERIYKAMNVESNDGTLKFGVGVNIRDQLVDLRDRLRMRRERKKSAKDSENFTKNDDDASNTGQASNDYHRVESTSNIGVVVNPAEVKGSAQETTNASTCSTSHPQSLQERLKQAEERELVILHALQELKANLQLHKAPRMVPTQGQVTANAKPTSPNRLPLLKRVGSFVGLTDSRAQTSSANLSPTRYTDELFSQNSAPLLSQKLEGHKAPAPSRHYPKARRDPSFTFSSEIESHRSITENFDLPAKRAFPPIESSQASEQIADSSHSQAEVQPEINQRRLLFQRMPSQSLRMLHGASRPATKGAPSGHVRRRTFQRTHSQSLRTLTEALTAYNAPRQSLTTGQARVLKRMSSFVSDSGGQKQEKRSPTRYADELFRRRSVEISKEHVWDKTT